ncbi:MAG: DUF2752 domain-containing protein [Planctomycetota bacterium]
MPDPEDLPERRLLGPLRLGARRPAVNRATRIELAFFVGVLALALWTAPVTADGRANAPLMGSLEQSTGGGLCVFRRMTGHPCGGCGMTRAFVQLAHAQPRSALRLNPLAPVVFAWFCWRTLELLVLNVTRRRLRLAFPPRVTWALWGGTVLGFAVLFAIRLTRSAWPSL